MNTILRTLPLLLAAGGAAAEAPAPVPVILDTDIGSDIDDTWALCMLLGRPELEPKLIVTAFRDTERRTRLAAKMLERLGRTGIPLGRGVKTGDGGLNQQDWLGDYHLDGYPGTVHGDGVGAMIDVINNSPEPVTIIVIGPQSNLAAALERDPGIASNARVVSMAGSVYTGYNGNPEPSAEWNVRADVEAARAVFAAPWDIVMDPLDVCGTLRLEGERYRRVAEADTARAKVVIENYGIWAHRDKYPPDSSSILFDTVAVYLAYDQALCEMETIKLSIDDKGNTVPDENGRPVSCALKWTNRDAFEELLIDSLVKALPEEG